MVSAAGENGGLTMFKILSIAMTVLCIVWAIYGIVVFWRWDKAALMAKRLWALLL